MALAGTCWHNCITCGIGHGGEVCPRLWLSKAFHKSHGCRKTVPPNVRIRPSPKDCLVLIAMGHKFFASVQSLAAKADQPSRRSAVPPSDPLPDEHAAKKARDMEIQLAVGEARYLEVERMRQEENRMRRRAEDEAAAMRAELKRLKTELNEHKTALDNALQSAKRKRRLSDVAVDEPELLKKGRIAEPTSRSMFEAAEEEPDAPLSYETASYVDRDMTDAAAEEPTVPTMFEAAAQEPAERTMLDAAGDEPTMRTMLDAAADEPTVPTMFEAALAEPTGRTMFDAAAQEPTGRTLFEAALAEPTGRTMFDAAADEPREQRLTSSSIPEDIYADEYEGNPASANKPTSK